MLGHTFSLMQREFEAKYLVTTTIRHKGEKGRQREHGQATLLREHLPTAYGVATGELLPSVGEEHSPQCDIIIYDQLHYPILGKSDVVQLVPIEAVYCVIEAKSTITKAELVDAHAKIKKILGMPRSESKTTLRPGMRREPFFVVFGYSLATATATVEEWVAENPTCLVVALDSGLGFVAGEKATWMSMDDNESLRYATLAFFYCLLLILMQRVDLGEPDFWKIVLGDE